MRDSGPERVHSTLIQSVIEGLDILGVVTADRIEAHIVSEHVSGGSGEPTVTLAGTRFENLKIAGVPVEVDLATDVLDRYDTHAKFCEGYRGDERVRGLFRRNPDEEEKEFRPSFVNRFLSHLSDEPAEELPSVNGITGLSLVRSMGKPSPLFKRYGHVIHVQGFGTIRLAEVGVSSLTRSVTMMHVNMGSPVMGDMAVGSGEDGGSDW